MPQEGKHVEHIMKATNSIAEEIDFIEGGSEWLETDLSYLIQSSVDVQLKAILGSESAESFLHPTIKDQNKVKSNARFQISKRLGALDAHQLWNDLRASSKSKLQESGISRYCQKRDNQSSNENKLLRGILFSRHRADLMHRVSRMNRSKTKEMMKDFFLPSFDDDFSDLIQSKTDLTSPTLQLTSTTTDNIERNAVACKQRHDARVKFVSEDDCRCEGGFKERLQELGITLKTGISIVDKGFHRNNTMQSIQKSHSEVDVANKLSTTAEDEAKDLYSRLNSIVYERQRSETSSCKGGKSCVLFDAANESWEPLTMQALIQQGKKTVDVVSHDRWHLR